MVGLVGEFVGAVPRLGACQRLVRVAANRLLSAGTHFLPRGWSLQRLCLGFGDVLLALVALAELDDVEQEIVGSLHH